MLLIDYCPFFAGLYFYYSISIRSTYSASGAVLSTTNDSNFSQINKNQVVLSRRKIAVKTATKIN